MRSARVSPGSAGCRADCRSFVTVDTRDETERLLNLRELKLRVGKNNADALLRLILLLRHDQTVLWGQEGRETQVAGMCFLHRMSWTQVWSLDSKKSCCCSGNAEETRTWSWRPGETRLTGHTCHFDCTWSIYCSLKWQWRLSIVFYSFFF